MKRVIFLACLLFASSFLFSEPPKGQILNLNTKANEEIIIINYAYRKEAFKIYIHTTDATSFHLNAFSASVINSEEGWIYLTKTPEIIHQNQWKSSQDYELLEHADYICIDTKSGNKYIYEFETKHDKLYITVLPYKESDDW